MPCAAKSARSRSAPDRASAWTSAGTVCPAPPGEGRVTTSFCQVLTLTSALLKLLPMRMVGQLPVAAGVVLAMTVLSGCAAAGAARHSAGPPAAALPAGSSTHSIEIGGVSRTYNVDRPVDRKRV